MEGDCKQVGSRIRFSKVNAFSTRVPQGTVERGACVVVTDPRHGDPHSKLNTGANKPKRKMGRKSKWCVRPSRLKDNTSVVV